MEHGVALWKQRVVSTELYLCQALSTAFCINYITQPATPTCAFEDGFLNGGGEHLTIDPAFVLLAIQPVLVLDGEDTDYTEGAVELLLPGLSLSCVHFHAIHKPSDLDLRVILANVYHNTRDFGGQRDCEHVLGLWWEDEHR